MVWAGGKYIVRMCGRDFVVGRPLSGYVGETWWLLKYCSVMWEDLTGWETKVNVILGEACWPVSDRNTDARKTRLSEIAQVKGNP